MNDQEKKTYRDRILTELFNSKILHEKAELVCTRNGINWKLNHLNEDVLMQCFLELSKVKPDTIIRLYEQSKQRTDGKSNLIAFALRVMIRNGVLRKHNAHPDYTKNAVARYLLQFSNLQQSKFLSPTETADGDDSTNHWNTYPVLMDASTEENDWQNVWDVITEELTEEELQDLHLLIDNPKIKKRAAGGEQLTQKRERLYTRLHTIITQNKINIRMDQQTVFNNIEQLLPILHQIINTGSATITAEQKILLQATYRHLHPGVNPDLSCQTCVSNLLRNLSSYYEREHPKWLAEQAVKEEIEASTKANKKVKKR